MNSNRREFFKVSMYSILGTGLAVSLSRCGDDSAESSSSSCGDFEWTIAGNHGHACAAIDVASKAAQLEISIQGTSGHNHTVSLTAADLTALQKAGGTVSKTTSSGGGHTHAITIFRLG